MKLKKCVYPSCFDCEYKDCYITSVFPQERKAQDYFDREMICVDPEVGKRRERQKRYETTQKGIERRKRYLNSEKGQEAQRQYEKSEKGRDRQKKYRNSEKGQEMLRRYYEKRKIMDRIRKEERLMKLGVYLSSLNKPELEEILRICNFTDDERKVFEMLSNGFSITEISLDLGVSLTTAKRRAKGVSDKMRKMDNNKNSVPIWEKMTMTVEEAAAYSNIGQNKIIELAKKPGCPFVLYVGKKKLIKRREFEKFVSDNIEI